MESQFRTPEAVFGQRCRHLASDTAGWHPRPQLPLELATPVAQLVCCSQRSCQWWLHQSRGSMSVLRDRFLSKPSASSFPVVLRRYVYHSPARHLPLHPAQTCAWCRLCNGWCLHRCKGATGPFKRSFQKEWDISSVVLLSPHSCCW